MIFLHHHSRFNLNQFQTLHKSNFEDVRSDKDLLISWVPYSLVLRSGHFLSNFRCRTKLVFNIYILSTESIQLLPFFFHCPLI